MGNPISLGYGGPLAYESITVYSDHVSLLFSSLPTLSGASALASNWKLNTSGPSSSVTSVQVVGNSINVYFTSQLNGASYTLSIPSGIVDGGGNAATAPIFITYTAIGVGPSIIAVHVQDARTLVVYFNVAINTTDAVNVANYGINNGLQVLSAVLTSPSVVTLTTTKQTLGTSYILTASVHDLAGNAS